MRFPLRAEWLGNPKPVSKSMKWMDIARAYLGMTEIVGPHHNPKVVGLWKTARIPGVDDDETPWCAAFVSAVLEEAGIVSARTGWACSYLKWGIRLGAPAVGCIVVFERGPNAGHVGFVVGKDKGGHLMVLGGNQSNAVNINPFERKRVLGYRWPWSGPLGADRAQAADLTGGRVLRSSNWRGLR